MENNASATRITRVNEKQPSPGGDGDIVYKQVIKDLHERAEIGKNTYGTFLKTNNGRDALVDAYQEALDLCLYLRQEIMERDENG